jgi:L-iditol 2-dehydrogenase
MLDPSAVAPGDRVLVTGPGPMGILAAQVARALGGDVVVSGLPSDRERLDVAAEIELAVTTDGPGDRPYDVAIEASGAGPALVACLEALRPGGRLVQVGIFGKPVTAPLDLVLLKELELFTGFASTPLAWRRAVGLIERRDVALGPLVSNVAPLREWEQVFADLRAGRGLKIALDPTQG